MDERERLAKIIESERMSAKQFAAEIGVSAGTISNILGGRNKASTDILVRILNRFRTISTDWLLLGTGSMYRPNGGIEQTTLFGDLRPQDPAPATETAQPAAAPAAYAAPVAVSAASRASVPQPAPQRQIARIIVYYTDGTYEER